MSLLHIFDFVISLVLIRTCISMPVGVIVKLVLYKHYCSVFVGHVRAFPKELLRAIK